LRNAPQLTLIAAAAEADGVPCETVIGSLREPSDFADLPVVADEGVRLEPPSWAKRLQAAQAGYLFLDELSTSPPAVQAEPLPARPRDLCYGERTLVLILGGFRCGCGIFRAQANE
jgi:hypothetical protein